MNQKTEIQKLINRLRAAIHSRTWVNLPEDLEEAANTLEDLQATIADLEERLTAWNNWKTEIDEAVNTYGSYKP